MLTERRSLFIARILMRATLGVTFLVACADRVGFLGPYGSRNVSWGDWRHFEQYVGLLNAYFPKSLIPVLSVVETVIEVTLALALFAGIYPRAVSWCSAALLLSFALTMSVAQGIVAPVSYSVWTAAAAAFLLGATAPQETHHATAVTVR
jgi:uncharacterized membrane protein YphA (DoxX/SURF4 family)